MVLMTHGSPIVRAAFPLEIVTRWLSFPPWRYAMYVCVYHETSALGRKLFSWFPCFVFRIFLKTTGFFRFPHNPELSLFGSLSTVIFFFLFFNKISDLGKKGKSSSLCWCFEIPKPRFCCRHRSYCPYHFRQSSFKNHDLTKQSSLNSAHDIQW